MTDTDSDTDAVAAARADLADAEQRLTNLPADAPGHARTLAEYGVHMAKRKLARLTDTKGTR